MVDGQGAVLGASTADRTDAVLVGHEFGIVLA
jgi:hypothetical protein